ncbi:inactive 2'-5'-oligoadenylate synthase 1B-like [Anneissia japonica]|uniref:inactive 2'-5'-oligoadenylate synthase 1B-like n=1 Tax=Anneissia japonica TaxID=1529436 RepID=UPI0014259EE9|nr:inactive 2'-5'-oligoadenylate synthase 1B-like [Anneissia japonica]
MDKPWNLTIPGDFKRYLEELRPTKSTTEQLNGALEGLIEKLKKIMSVAIGRVGMAGSWGKATSTQDDIHVNLLLYVTDLRAIEDHSKQLPSLLNEIREYLKKDNYIVMRDIADTQQYVPIYLPTSDGMVTCNIYPTVDLLGSNPSQANVCTFYRKLLTVSERSPYNATILEIQSKLIKDTPDNLHDLLRVVKVWQTTKLALRGGAPKPEFFELITLHCWCKAGSPLTFDVRKGLIDVLGTLGDWSGILVIWGGTSLGRYDRTSMEEAAKHMGICFDDTPIVMDPVDPYLNYCSGIRRLVWEETARIARETIDHPLLNEIKITTDWH